MSTYILVLEGVVFKFRRFDIGETGMLILPEKSEYLPLHIVLSHEVIVPPAKLLA